MFYIADEQTRDKGVHNNTLFQELYMLARVGLDFMTLSYFYIAVIICRRSIWYLELIRRVITFL